MYVVSTSVVTLNTTTKNEVIKTTTHNIHNKSHFYCSLCVRDWVNDIISAQSAKGRVSNIHIDSVETINDTDFCFGSCDVTLPSGEKLKVTATTLFAQG